MAHNEPAYVDLCCVQFQQFFNLFGASKAFQMHKRRRYTVYPKAPNSTFCFLLEQATSLQRLSNSAKISFLFTFGTSNVTTTSIQQLHIQLFVYFRQSDVATTSIQQRQKLKNYVGNISNKCYVQITFLSSDTRDSTL